MSTHPGTSGERILALVVDAHEPTRVGFAFLLQRQPWVDRCLLAADQRRAIALTERFRPAVAVVDVSNAGPFAAHLTDALRAAHPGLRLVLTSRCGHAPYVRHAGATGYLAPDAPSGTVVETVRAAAFGDPHPPLQAASDHERLSAREREVLELLATGATNREIAAALHLGPDSVKKHASSLYRKLGVRNRTEATQRAASVLVA